MTWPTGAVNTANTDASTDSPANARADFLDLEQKVNQIIAHGAPVLQAGTQTIDGSKTFSSSPSVPNASTSGHAVAKGQMDAADGLRLLKSSNLSDLANAATALANLGGVPGSAFIGGNQSLVSSGYQKLPGGLIFQWVSPALTIGVDGNYDFPLPFPVGVFWVAGWYGNTSIDTNYILFANPSSNSQFNIHWQAISSTNGNGQGVYGRVLAIGY